MKTMQLSQEGGIHILTLTNNDNENKLNQDVMEEYLAAFNEVEQYEGDTALLITCEHEKTFSTGINLEWLGQLDAKGLEKFIKSVEEVCLKLAVLSVPTVGCLNGNTYAGAAIIASALDFRVMRSDRGRFCFPEVNIRIPFTKIMMETARLIPSPRMIEEMSLTGRALTGEECLEHGLVTAIYPKDELQSQARALANELAQKDRATYSAIKHLWRKDILALKEECYPTK